MNRCQPGIVETGEIYEAFDLRRELTNKHPRTHNEIDDLRHGKIMFLSCCRNVIFFLNAKINKSKVKSTSIAASIRALTYGERISTVNIGYCRKSKFFFVIFTFGYGYATIWNDWFAFENSHTRNNDIVTMYNHCIARQNLPTFYGQILKWMLKWSEMKRTALYSFPFAIMLCSNSI